VNQGGDENDQDKEDDQELRDQRPPHPRVHQAIHKEVTTRSQVTDFYEHFSFVSSIEPYRVEDALRDPD
jgi:hypothetical protein